MDQRPIAARFRWGEPGLSFTGAAQIGEVEDYFFPLNSSAGDYNHDNIVDQLDFIVWKVQNGQQVVPFSGADGNGDGVVNQADLDIYQRYIGQTYPIVVPGAGAVALTAGEDGSQNSSPSGGGLSIDDLAAIENSSSPSTSMPGTFRPTSPSTSDTQVRYCGRAPVRRRSTRPRVHRPSSSLLTHSLWMPAVSSIQSTSTVSSARLRQFAIRRLRLAAAGSNLGQYGEQSFDDNRIATMTVARDCANDLKPRGCPQRRRRMVEHDLIAKSKTACQKNEGRWPQTGALLFHCQPRICRGSRLDSLGSVAASVTHPSPFPPPESLHTHRRDQAPEHNQRPHWYTLNRHTSTLDS
jgi:hypothetical protein